MKKIISVIIICMLLFSLSINTLAVGNTYTFTSSWFQLIFQNIVAYNNNTESTYNQFTGVMSVDGLLYNSDSDYNNTVVWIKSLNSLKPGSYSITIPLNITLGRGYDKLDLEFFTSYSNSVKINSATFMSNNSNISATVNSYDINSVSFGHLVFSSPSSELGVFESDFSGYGQKINISYIKSNTSTNDMLIDSVTLNFTCVGSSFAIGVPCVDKLVTLPDYLYDAIYNIKYITRQIYSYFGQLNTYVLDIQSQLDEIIGKVGSSTEEQNNYYNTIINESPEQAEKLAALQAELEQAKQDLADFQEKFNSYDPPVPDEVLPDEEVTQITIDSLNNEDTSVVYGLLFGNELFLGILVMTLSIATIGYILYGKRA